MSGSSSLAKAASEMAGNNISSDLHQGGTSIVGANGQAVEPIQAAELVAELRLRAGRPTGTFSRRNGSHGRKDSGADGNGSGEGSTGVSPADDLPPSGSGMSPADTLDLCHRKIDRVPDEVIKIVKDEVVRLALGYNLLTSLSASFAQLSRLRYLNIRANLLTTFPSVITELPCLEILDISRNKVRTLPEEPGRLLNLRVLSISHNKLKRLPKYMAKLRHLKVLKIENNPLVWPPPHVATVPQPTTVDNLTPAGAEGRTAMFEEADREKERERLLVARRKAEDRTMNAWIKELQTWIADHSGERPRREGSLLAKTLTD